MAAPKEAEATVPSPQALGVIGRADSASSTSAASRRPKESKYFVTRPAPAASASLAVPMLEEWMKMSSSVITLFSAW